MTKKEKKKYPFEWFINCLERNEELLNHTIISILTTLSALALFGTYLFLKPSLDLFMPDSMKSNIKAIIIITIIIFGLFSLAILLDKELHYKLIDLSFLFFILFDVIVFYLIKDQSIGMITIIILIILQIGYLEIKKDYKSFLNKIKKTNIIIAIMLVILILICLKQLLILLLLLLLIVLPLVFIVIMPFYLIYLNNHQHKTKISKFKKNKEKKYAYQAFIIFTTLFFGMMMIYSTTAHNYDLSNIPLKNKSPTNYKLTLDCNQKIINNNDLNLTCNLTKRRYFEWIHRLIEYFTNKKDLLKITSVKLRIDDEDIAVKSKDNYSSFSATINNVERKTHKFNIKVNTTEGNKNVTFSKTLEDRHFITDGEFSTNKRIFFSGIGALVLFIINLIIKFYELNTRRD